jgi:hypothetical protein
MLKGSSEVNGVPSLQPPQDQVYSTKVGVTAALISLGLMAALLNKGMKTARVCWAVLCFG